MDISEARKERLSVPYWVLNKKIVNEKGRRIEFQRHKFLFQPYGDLAAEQVIMKSSQVGASTMEVIRTHHDARFFGINQIYTLPTGGDVNDFVKTKVNPIANHNPCIREGLDPKSIDTIEQKQIGKAFIFYRGTWTERAAQMITADRNLHDELDRSNLQTIDAYRSRQYADDIVKERRLFSTPTVPNFGIHAAFLESDQKVWRFNCPHCRHRQHMEWERNVDLERKIYICRKCNKELTPAYISSQGTWEAKYPKRSISGYWINQMMCPWFTARELVDDFNNPATDRAFFYNFRLGLPYLDADQQINAGLFLKNVRAELKDLDLEKQNVMGMDCGGGKGNHVVIGNKKGVWYMDVLKDKFVSPDGAYFCEYCGRSKGVGKCGCRWEQAAQLIEQFNISTTVCDAMPYTEETFNLAKRFQYRVYLSWFNDDPKMLGILRFADDEPSATVLDLHDAVKVYISRTRVMDHAVADLRRGSEPFAMRAEAAGLQMLIHHAKTMYAREIEDRNGQRKREWANTGANDMWLGYCYFKAALLKESKYEPNT